jgi:large subunit ribosomal protein L25
MTASDTAYVLHAENRELQGKQVKQLRLLGQIPAVCYGHNKQAQPLTVDSREFHQVFRSAGMSSLLDLVVGKHKPVKVLIHDIQEDPVRSTVLHVDFFQVNLKEKLRVTIPLKLVGVADAVDVLGGSLLEVKDEVEVECLPEDLIHEIEVDITPLKTFADTLHIRDLKVPQGIEILTDGDEVIALVNEPRSEAEMEELETPVVGTITTESETDSGTEESPENAEGEPGKE